MFGFLILALRIRGSLYWLIDVQPGEAGTCRVAFNPEFVQSESTDAPQTFNQGKLIGLQRQKCVRGKLKEKESSLGMGHSPIQAIEALDLVQLPHLLNNLLHCLPHLDAERLAYRRVFLVMQPLPPIPAAIAFG